MNTANYPLSGVLQVFVGRWEQANLRDHPGQVLQRLVDFDWQSWHQLGIDTIYLLGLFDNRGPIIVGEEQGVDLRQRADRLPSPFALSNHRQVNPVLGTEAEARVLIQKLQSLSFKVLVDFVPNHTGTSHPWVTEHPDYYVTDSFKPLTEFSGDVYKLNYGNPKLRAAMIQVLEWLADLGVDGVRVDMAHYVANDFWEEAWTTIQSRYPKFIALAEAYVSNLYDLSPLLALQKTGFTAIYHEPLYRNIKTVFEANGDAAGLVAHIDYVARSANPRPVTESQIANTEVEAETDMSPDLRALFGFREETSATGEGKSRQVLDDGRPLQWLHYLANHDDALPPAALPYLPALCALTIFLPGSFLVYNGLLQGLDRRLAHHYVDILPESLTLASGVADRLKRWFTLRSQLKLHVASCFIENSLVCVKLQGEAQTGTLWLNLSRQTLMLPIEVTSTGLVLGKQAGQELLIGQAELFI